MLTKMRSGEELELWLKMEEELKALGFVLGLEGISGAPSLTYRVTHPKLGYVTVSYERKSKVWRISDFEKQKFSNPHERLVDALAEMI